MYGQKQTAFLSLIFARLGQGIGQVMLAVLLLNVLATAALSAQSAADIAAAQDDPFALTQSVIICTPQGLKRITLDENGDPVENTDDGAGNCIHCLPCHKGALQATSYENGLSPVALLDSYRFSLDKGLPFPLASSCNRACRPRAPPAA